MVKENSDLHVDLMFPSKYLKAADLEGKDVTVTIAAVKKDTLKMKDQTEKVGYIVSFEGTKTGKMFVLNKTNANVIAAVLGEKRARLWAGKRITLYPTTCMSFGKRVDCIRVRETVNAGPNLSPPPGPVPKDLPGDDQGS